MAYMRTPERDNARSQVIPPERRESVGQRLEERPGARYEDTTTARLTGGGSALEALGGAGAATLAIIGVAGVLPLYMCAIATIAAGGALVLHGGSIAARWKQLMSELEGGRFQEVDVGTGASAELLGGAAGVVLGVLALIGVAQAVLLPVAAIVLGAGLLFSGAAEPAFADVRLGADMSPRYRKAASEAVKASSSALVLAGLGAGVLGIIGLVGTITPLTASLIAMICVGGALFLGGGALVARVAKAMT